MLTLLRRVIGVFFLLLLLLPLWYHQRTGQHVWDLTKESNAAARKVSEHPPCSTKSWCHRDVQF